MNLYSLTSSIDNQRKSNHDKINNNYNDMNYTNENYRYKKKYIIDEDDDIVNINPFIEIKRPLFKKHKTSILFHSKENPLKSSNNYESIYKKKYSDNNKINKPILELEEDILNSLPNKGIYHIPYKRNTFNPTIYRNETQLKITLPDIRKIPAINNNLNPLSISHNEINLNNYINNNNNNNNNDNNNNKSNNESNIIENINETIDDDLLENPLYDFLNKINMGKYYKNLSLNGFDDIKLIIEQTKNNDLGITDDNLKEAGIFSPGDRAKIIIKVQDLANNFSYPIPKEVYYTCKNLIDVHSDKNIVKLNNWLKSISVENLLNNFISNGYHSIELLLVQIDSKEPLTLEKLKELGIEKIGFRQRIINKLKDDGKKFQNKLKNNLLIYDEKKRGEICNDCNIF